MGPFAYKPQLESYFYTPQIFLGRMYLTIHPRRQLLLWYKTSIIFWDMYH
mgnify:CR=1